MLTVLIYDELLSSIITEYKPFWDPFLTSGEFALCSWRKQGKTLQDAVPELYSTIGEEVSWRAVILYHAMAEPGSNPFDFFDGNESASEVEKNDLIRLTHMLSIVPHRVQFTPVGMTDKDYILDHELKLEKKTEDKEYYTLGESNFNILCARPNKIILLATRKKKLSHELLRISRKEAQGHNLRNINGSFCDRNDYPSNVRYLLYDASCYSEQLGERDRFILMHAVMTLLMNEHVLMLRAEEVYSLQIKIDEEKLEKWICEYQGKMEFISSRIHMIHVYLQEEWEDRRNFGELPQFNTNYYIDLSLASPDTYEISEKAYKLFKDKPLLDLKVWRQDKAVSHRAVEALLKEPLRKLRYSLDEIRKTVKSEERPVKGRFSREQLEDARIQMELLERGMFQGDATPVAKLNEEERDKQEHLTENMLLKRMTRPMALLGLLFAVVIFAVGFIPYFSTSGVLTDIPAWTMMLMLIAVGSGILFVVWLGFLIVSRWRLHRKIRKINAIISKVVESYRELQRQYQDYVTKAFNYRKYWGFTRQLHEDNDRFYVDEGEKREINLLRHRNAVYHAKDFISRVCKSMNITCDRYDFYKPEDPLTFTLLPEKSGYYELDWQERSPDNQWADETEVYYGYVFVSGFGIKREEMNA